MPPKFLTPAEFARATQTSEETVRRLLRRGDLPGVHVGGAWRIHESVLARLEAAASTPRLTVEVGK